MKKVNMFLKHKKVNPENLISFPNDKMITFPWGAKGFVYFVDAENGNDNNSGLTLKNAKKTFNAVLDLLPTDLLGREVRIFVHPGTYTNADSRTVISIASTNGTIYFHWLGTWANPDDPNFVENDKSIWLANLLDGVKVRNNNQVVISGVSVTSGQASCLSATFSNNFTTSVYILSNNFAKEWDQVSSQYAYRWKFMQDDTCITDHLLCSSRLNNLCILNPIEIDFSYYKYSAFFVDSYKARIDAIHAYSRVLTASNSKTGYWNGVINLGPNCTSNVSLENVYYPSNAYHPDYSKSSTPWIFEGCRQVFGIQNGSKACLNIGNTMQYLQGLLSDANPPQIYLGDQAQPTIDFNSTVATLIDNSSAPHTITDRATGVVFIFLGSGLKKIANHFQFPLQTTAQSDSYLQNKDVSFYIDEVNHKLKVKLKYSNGVIKTGEISLQ
ncbi:MAG: hypothetical protein QHH13_11585 [Melioribacter sp.]|nr:hypothetical protein [Melioribacter sp.]